MRVVQALAVHLESLAIILPSTEVQSLPVARLEKAGVQASAAARDRAVLISLSAAAM